MNIKKVIDIKVIIKVTIADIKKTMLHNITDINFIMATIKKIKYLIIDTIINYFFYHSLC